MTVSEAPVISDKATEPSKYQYAIFEWIVFGNGNAVVEAVAGSGKTWTCVRAVQYLPLALAYKRGVITEQQARDIFSSNDISKIQPYEYLMADTEVAFLAFNKHIATELKSRLPAWCYAATLHSLGYADLREALGKIDVDEDKRWNALFEPYPNMRFPKIWKEINKEERTKRWARRNSFKRLVSLTKATLTNPSDREEVLSLIDHYGLDLEENTESFLYMLPGVMNASRENTKLIDFDDMQWLPIELGIPLKKFDFMFVDESQDLSDNQAEFVIRSIKPGGRIVAVGDSFQSLYGFRGAGVDSIQNLIKALNATTLPLSITYRCPLSHVKLAQKIVPQLEARENAPEGVIADMTEIKMQAQVGLGDMIVCRTNAPLVPVAFGLIRKGIKATIRGRDIGKNLSDISNKISSGCKDMESYFFRLGEYFLAEMTRLENRHASDTQIQSLEDKVDTLHAVAGECNKPEEVGTRIESIFSDENGEIVLSSVHRCKGLESGTVWILRPDLMPFPKARQDWEKQQENNILYVAQTRSKENLYFVRN